ncbi:hypothetical protein [Arthrobacter sp. TB 26]|uniref:hypothetical protein n=1 Tax=Arthrobacter sp. TB 26 TaxID=494420 RepID=UPI00040BE4F7|nr:hypothetical protein [Arthrobacter sp. TB 26]
MNRAASILAEWERTSGGRQPHDRTVEQLRASAAEHKTTIKKLRQHIRGLEDPVAVAE